MRILLDTSVLVAALVNSHQEHHRALPWLKRVTKGTDAGLVAAHSLAELYAILTTYPGRPRLSSTEVIELIEQSVLSTCEIVSLSSSDYTQVIRRLSVLGIIGGATYDALVVQAGVNSKVDLIVTLNEKDFRRVYPSLTAKIIPP